jgi:hypothetical protein
LAGCSVASVATIITGLAEIVVGFIFDKILYLFEKNSFFLRIDLFDLFD